MGVLSQIVANRSEQREVKDKLKVIINIQIDLFVWNFK